MNYPANCGTDCAEYATTDYADYETTDYGTADYAEYIKFVAVRFIAHISRINATATKYY